MRLFYACILCCLAGISAAVASDTFSHEEKAVPVRPGSVVLDSVEERLAELVPQKLSPYFDLYLFVSKAESGPAAQRMYVFGRGEAEAYKLLHVFLVSTGRERQERYFTTTPTGIFKLDPDRFYTFVRSQRWDGAVMSFAMFLDYSYRTRLSGLAVHAANQGNAHELGLRASGGCIRVEPDKAVVLFDLVKNNYAGKVPEFAFDNMTGTTSRKGVLKRGQNGKPIMADGYRVLLIIDDFAGPISTAGTH